MKRLPRSGFVPMIDFVEKENTTYLSVNVIDGEEIICFPVREYRGPEGSHPAPGITEKECANAMAWLSEDCKRLLVVFPAMPGNGSLTGVTYDITKNDDGSIVVKLIDRPHPETNPLSFGVEAYYPGLIFRGSVPYPTLHVAPRRLASYTWIAPE